MGILKNQQSEVSGEELWNFVGPTQFKPMADWSCLLKGWMRNAQTSNNVTSRFKQKNTPLEGGCMGKESQFHLHPFSLKARGVTFGVLVHFAAQACTSICKIPATSFLHFQQQLELKPLLGS